MKKAIPGFILLSIFIVLIVSTVISIKSDFTRSSTRTFHYEANGVTYDGILEVNKPLNSRQWKKIENKMIEKKITSGTLKKSADIKVHEELKLDTKKIGD